MQVNSSYKDILSVALPVMIGSLATTLLNITDSAFLGRVGEIELGASAIGGILYFTFVMIGFSIGTGVQIQIARKAGERDHSGIGPVFDQAIVVLVVVAVFLFILLRFAMPTLVIASVRDMKVALAVNEFLSYRSFGIFFIMIATAFRSFYVGVALPKVFAVYSFIMAGLNIVLGAGLIFGKWNFPEMGISGAGLASSLSEALALVFMVIWTATRPKIKEFRLFRFDNLSWSLTRKLLLLSAPLILQNLLSMGAWFLFFVFIEKIGTHELAVSNAARGAYMMAMTPIWGYAVAANSMTSNLIGQNRQVEVMALNHKMVYLALLTSAFTGLSLLLFPETIIGIFTPDKELIRHSLGTIQVVIASLFFFSTANVLLNSLSGTGATRTVLRLEFFSIFLYMIHIYVTTFVIRSSVEVVWLSEIVYWGFIGIGSYLYLRKGDWKNIIV